MKKGVWLANLYLEFEGMVLKKKMPPESGGAKEPTLSASSLR